MRTSLVGRLWTLILTVPVVAAAATTSPVALTRGPYLQLLTTQSVTVVWNTNRAAACVLAIHAIGGATAILQGPTSTICAIAVNHLVPGQRYGYTPRAGTTSLRTESIFHTDDPGAPYTFLVVGDTGGGGSHQLRVRDRMAAIPADFMLHTGDMIYETGAAVDFDPKYFVPYKDLIRVLDFWPCLGNHDIMTNAGGPYRDFFYTPANNPARTENYYSFDYGNAHVAVLDSNASLSSTSAQYVWLDRDLGTSTATWNFVAFHHSIYSSGPASNTSLRSRLVPLFDKHGVDLVFMGHAHIYERTKPLHDNAVVAPGAGTVYVTTGGGGESISGIGQSSWTAYTESAFHFTRVDVDGTRLTLRMVREDGAVRDTLSLDKGPRCGDGVVNVPVEECDGADDAACPDECSAECTCPVPAAPIALAPLADTFVKAGSDAGLDHGGSTEVQVDASPASVAYLKFDLSAVTTGVAHAVLDLRVTNPTPDGGTVYRIGSSGWIEGTAKGASGPGLKWNDIDTNRNGVLDSADASKLVPLPANAVAVVGAVKLGQTVHVDVTAAFAAGPGVYTLAIASKNTDGANYVSRESSTAAARPVLWVTPR